MVGLRITSLTRLCTLSAPDDDAAPRVRVAVVRAALFLGFWLMISGRNMSDLPVGLAAVAVATWTSLRLLPAGGSRPRPVLLAALALRFVRQSVISGTLRGARSIRGFNWIQASSPTLCVCRRAERVLRSFQSAAWNSANRDGRKRGAPRPLPRCWPASCRQFGRGRDYVYPGTRP
jgi:hypothetical protein